MITVCPGAGGACTAKPRYAQLRPSCHPHSFLLLSNMLLLVVALLLQLAALSQLIVMGWLLGVLKAQLLPDWKPHRRPSESGMAL